MSDSFAELPLDPRLLSAVATLGFSEPTPIQRRAIPLLLDGRDVVGGARTGSGKTAAFGLPLLHRVRDGGRQVRGLVLTPTRELALQVRDALADLGRELKIKVLAIYGGAPYQPQMNALKNGAPIVVGTPGRVLDLLNGGHLDLSGVEMLVLDEADEMLRMGFIEDVELITAATPPTRQVALFSATMPDPIRRIAEKYLRQPAEVQVEETSHTTEHISQRWIRVPQEQKMGALVRLLSSEPRGTTLVFVRTRENALEASEALANRGLNVESLHGGLSQPARERVLRRVRASNIDILVATDVAARGLDVDHVTHVVNLDLPEDRDVYVHRIGRTGRAGRAGVAVTFVTPKQVHAMRQIARHVGAEVEQVPVPTERDVARHTRKRVADALLAQPEDDDVRGFLTELTASSGKTGLDLAMAATSLLLRTRGLTVGTDDRPPVAEAAAAVFLAPLAAPAAHEAPEPVSAVLADEGAPVERVRPNRVERERPARVERERPARVEGERPARVEREAPVRVERERPARVERDRPPAARRPADREHPAEAQAEGPARADRDRERPAQADPRPSRPNRPAARVDRPRAAPPEEVAAEETPTRKPARSRPRAEHEARVEAVERVPRRPVKRPAPTGPPRKPRKTEDGGHRPARRTPKGGHGRR